MSLFTKQRGCVLDRLLAKRLLFLAEERLQANQETDKKSWKRNCKYWFSTKYT
jgi:hypothetical protein